MASHRAERHFLEKKTQPWKKTFVQKQQTHLLHHFDNAIKLLNVSFWKW